MVVLRRLYRTSLYLFPGEFRHAYGTEMEEIFAERLAGLTFGAACAIALDEVVDAAISGVRARIGRSAQLRPALIGSLGAIVVAAIITVPHDEWRPGVTAFTAPDSIDFNAQDPAGEFTLSVRKGRPVAATIDHVPLPRNRLLHSGDSVRFLGPTGRVVLAVAYYRNRGRIEWEARPRFCHGRAENCPLYQ